jgi:cysteine desulfuration protein SufE
MDSLEKTLIRFRTLSREMRLQMLLNYAKKFPDLPEALQEARDEGLNRVEECQTPLFLWVGLEEGRVRIHADAPKEAPTVRGFMGFLIEQLNGAAPEEVEALPLDLLERMGLGEVLGTMRTNGLSHVLIKIRREAARLSVDGDA